MATSTGIMSNYYETSILNHMLRGINLALPTYFWLTVYSNADGAGEADTGTEKTTGVGEFSRVGILRSTELQAIDNLMSNLNALTFAQASSAWGTIYGWGLKNSSTAGNLLFWGLFDTPIVVDAGETLRIAADDLPIALYNLDSTHGGWSAFAASGTINWLVNNTPFTYTQNGTQLALGRNISLDSANNLLSWTECTGTGYARKLMTIGEWSSPSNGTCSNINEQVFIAEAIDGTWGTISDIVLYDNDTGINPIFWGHLPTALVISAGDGFKIPVGGISVQFS